MLDPPGAQHSTADGALPHLRGTSQMTAGITPGVSGRPDTFGDAHGARNAAANPISLGTFAPPAPDATGVRARSPEVRHASLSCLSSLYAPIRGHGHRARHGGDPGRSGRGAGTGAEHLGPRHLQRW